MDRRSDFDPARGARAWLGVAVLALASAAAIAWLYARPLALRTPIGGFERTVAADGRPVVVLPPVTVVARRSDVAPRAAAQATPPRG